jgi:hypothetical protein
MKWKAEPIKYDRQGDKRTLNKFAYLPVRLENNTFIWFERYKEDQTYQEADVTLAGRVDWGGWSTTRKHQDEDVKTKLVHWSQLKDTGKEF